MQDGVQDVDLLSTPPPRAPDDVEMTETEEPVSLPPLTESSPALSRQQSAAPSEDQPVRPVPYVEVKLLMASERSQYQTGLAERPITVDEAFPEEQMDCIIGEYENDGTVEYYVKMSSGLAFKFAAAEFREKHPRLAETYDQNKENGALEPFDPTAAYVHPKSRIKLTVKLGPRLRRGNESSEDELAKPYDSQSAEDDDDAFSLESEEGVPLRRSSRSTTLKQMKQSKLSFSPKKTRSRGPITTSHTTRRSTRTVSGRKADFDDEDYGDYESEEFEDSPVKTKGKKRAKAVKKAPRGYGLVHDGQSAFDEDPSGVETHRGICEKCHRTPTHILLEAAKKKPKKKSRKRKDEDELDDNEDDEDRLAALGGWVRCLRCPVAAHWGCLAKTQRDEILKAIRDKEKSEWIANRPTTVEGTDPAPEVEMEPTKRTNLEITQSTDFICGSCMKGGICMSCKEVVLLPGGVPPTSSVISSGPQPDAAPQEAPSEPTPTVPSEDVQMVDSTADKAVPPKQEEAPAEQLSNRELLYRCITCKRLSHYAHLPLPKFADPDEEYTPDDLAAYYQVDTAWKCADCVSFVYQVEHIIAWRPYPEDAVEPTLSPGEVPNHKTSLPREYLIKWIGRSYRRLTWVPHMWLLATHGTKLKNFLTKGPSIDLLPEPIAEAEAMVIDEVADDFVVGGDYAAEEGERRSKSHEESSGLALVALSDAERRIHPSWKTIDRVLDMLFWRPRKSKATKQSKAKSKRSRQSRADTDDDEDDVLESEDEEEKQWREDTYTLGEEPSQDLLETVAEREKRLRRQINSSDIDDIAWGFFKWTGLGYEDANWDSPPRRTDVGFSHFETAFKRFLDSRTVQVPILSRFELEKFDDRAEDGFRRKFAFKKDTQPELGQSDQLKLMPFQVDGVNWLSNNWWNLQPCILADEMGLGKTVQIVTFLGQIIKGFEGLSHSAFPALVIVPNSTITNWVREFERWAPNLRVVPFYGEAKARDIIKQYELFHPETKPRTTGAKFHVLVTTYETITNARDVSSVFKSGRRWEVLVVDEGQRLKSDSSLLFKKLTELNTTHRIILTGTPLNNNIRELFNLMNFLDPIQWRDLETLAREHEVLTEERVKELHVRLRPYFLRRVKADVLTLPPKNEVIVPLSMTPLQKEVYRSILSQNVEVLKSIAASAAGNSNNAVAKKTNMNNILMQLRKCIQHPYLVSPDIEPKDLSQQESHEKLIFASAKLLMLQTMLPKLKARGHRVLLFSQFAIALDIIEDFLIGEKYRYLRLDGNTKQRQRQRDMDEFNKPDSDVFIYILSTRAGGVGINLWTADTVIIYDPDFNPHQDLQAIARAHRFGQTKPCLVFKFMVKSSAEERIMQTGKKKMVLDHLIVQKMDDEDGESDMQSILMYGAQDLFKEGGQAERDIHYSENDIEKLIEKTEKEGDGQEHASTEAGSFSFAKVWEAENDQLQDIGDANEEAQDDAWAEMLARIAAETAKTRAREETGRGVRRKAAPVYPQQTFDFPDTPQKDKEKTKKKGKGKQKATSDDEDEAFHGSDAEQSDGQTTVSNAASEDMEVSLADALIKKQKKRKSRHVDDMASRAGLSAQPVPLSPIHNTIPLGEVVDTPCGLCGLVHSNRPCFMTESSENLIEYRRILMSDTGVESLEERRAAVAVIDETLYKRGNLKLIIGQPLHPVARNPPATRPPAPRPNFPVRIPHIPNGNGSAPARLTSSSHGGGQQVSGPPKPKPKPRIPHIPGTSNANAVAGSSRPPPTPIPTSAQEPPRKKVKENGVDVCVICGAKPSHSPQRCPAVAEGSRRIEQEIRRLEKQPGNSSTVHILKSLLVRNQQREQLAASGSGA